MRRAGTIVGVVVVVGWAFAGALGGCGGDDGTGAVGEPDAAQGGTSGGPADGSSGSSGGSGGSGGADGSIETDGGGDGAASSSGSNPGKITCGPAECNAEAQVCCRTQDDTTCVEPSDNCTLGARFACDEAADCPATESCCATVIGLGPRAKCSATCNVTEVRLCKTNAECGDEGPCNEKTCAGATLRICGDGPVLCN